ncbi:hypothetical protein MMC17_010293 [Xylographa soralifera]|nr:hypothetical protein [Xylographa soralifera]
MQIDETTRMFAHRESVPVYDSELTEGEKSRREAMIRLRSQAAEGRAWRGGLEREDRWQDAVACYSSDLGQDARDYGWGVELSGTEAIRTPSNLDTDLLIRYTGKTRSSCFNLDTENAEASPSLLSQPLDKAVVASAAEAEVVVNFVRHVLATMLQETRVGLTNGQNKPETAHDGRQECVYIDRVVRGGSESGLVTKESNGEWAQTVELWNSKQHQHRLASLLFDSQLTFGNLISKELAEKLELETEPCSEHWVGIGPYDGISSEQRTRAVFQGSSEACRLYEDEFFVVDTPRYDIIVGQQWMNLHPEITPRPHALPVFSQHKLTPESRKRDRRQEEAAQQKSRELHAYNEKIRQKESDERGRAAQDNR